MLCRNSAFHPQILSQSHASQHSFHPPQDSEAGLSGQSLNDDFHWTYANRTTNQLFVCYKLNCLGQPVTKTRLCHWVVDEIQKVYKRAGRPQQGCACIPHGTLLPHGPYGEVPPPSTFIKFYCMNVYWAQCSRTWLDLPCL